MSSMPIIRFELEGMRQAIVIALSDYMVRMDSDIQAAIDRVMTPENIAAVIEDTAKREIDAAIQSEIQSFFRFGNGRDIIKKAVADQLENRS